MKTILSAVAFLLVFSSSGTADNWILDAAFNGSGPSIVDQPHQFATHFPPYWNFESIVEGQGANPSKSGKDDDPPVDDDDKGSQAGGKRNYPRRRGNDTWRIYFDRTGRNAGNGGYSIYLGIGRPAASQGHWEWVETEEWVPGYYETIWVPPQYQNVWIPERYDTYGNWVPGYFTLVLAYYGYYTSVWREGYYRRVSKQVWVEDYR